MKWTGTQKRASLETVGTECPWEEVCVRLHQKVLNVQNNQYHFSKKDDS